MKTAWIIGATGLAGKQCLYRLLESERYDRILVWSRKELPVKHHKLNFIVCEMNQVATRFHSYRVDDLFVCLGTTLKNAGNKESFRAIDQGIPLFMANIALKQGAQRIFLLSAAGADVHSSIFYSRIKGELEEEVMKLPFSAIHIFRPSLLLGKRREWRPGEWFAQKVMKGLSFLFVGPLKSFRAISVEKLASIMVQSGEDERKGIIIHTNAEMAEQNISNLGLRK